MDEMDADAEPLIPEQMDAAGEDEEEWDGTEEMRKRVLQQYMDEVNKMDFNDVVAGIPIRFHYTTVPKANYSLKAADILMATDKELNEYVGMKALAAHKKRSRWDGTLAPKLGQLKRTLSKRDWGFAGLDRRGVYAQGHKKRNAEGEAKAPNRRKGKKERERERLPAVTSEDAKVEAIIPAEAPEPPQKKRKRNKSKGT